jgi:exopolysaccharide biosynthesis protein
MGSVGPRSFVANKGSTVYIGYVYNATMTESADVLKALGVDNAMNLDEGGSTALWFNGSYITGPGRDLANVVLFIRK